MMLRRLLLVMQRHTSHFCRVQRGKTMSTLSLGPPTAATCVPPGHCALSEEDWTTLSLQSKIKVSHDTSVFKFLLPNSNVPLNLSTCACILASATTTSCMDGDGDGGDRIVRPYTPVSTNSQLGSFDLMVKIYPDGQLSTLMHSLEVGETMDFKHIPFNVKTQYPFGKKRVGMIVGGTGITPMIQALHAILGTKDDFTIVDMIYASKSQEDILARKEVERWATQSNGRFKVHHILSDEPLDSDWTGERGFVSQTLINRVMPSPENDDEVLIFVCGPPVMYNAICGDRTEQSVTGLLGELGFSSEQVYKF